MTTIYVESSDLTTPSRVPTSLWRYDPTFIKDDSHDFSIDWYGQQMKDSVKLFFFSGDQFMYVISDDIFVNSIGWRGDGHTTLLIQNMHNEETEVMISGIGGNAKVLKYVLDNGVHDFSIDKKINVSGSVIMKPHSMIVLQFDAPKLPRVLKSI